MESREVSVLDAWVIYFDTKDFPKQYVLRKQSVTSKSEIRISPECAVADSIDEIRRKIPAGLVSLQRNVDDDPVILEVWM